MTAAPTADPGSPFAVLPVRVQRRIQLDPDSGCWLWTGRISAEGYGVMSWGGGSVHVYVVLWGLRHGDVPGDGDGNCLDHTCRVRACVNPSHLELVTYQQNTLRGNTIPAAHAAKVACVNGHPFDAVNTYMGRTTSGSPRRQCRQCTRDAGARYRSRKRAERKVTISG